jgi:APA family basic amino acid/polyamine antiporter
VLVSIGVIVLRYRDPQRGRGFRVPFGPVIPVLSIACCLLLMAGLPARTWLRFFVWLAIGLVVYVGYSRKRSEFFQG